MLATQSEAGAPTAAQEHSWAAGGPEQNDAQELVTCLLNKVEFGMNINAVQEIVRLPKITPVPKAPHYVRGLANLRGQVLPIVDPRLRFGMPHNEDEKNCRVVVLELNGSPTGLIVDAVREVLHVAGADIESPPAVVQGVDSKFLNGVAKLDQGKRLIMLIDQDKVIEMEGFDVAAAKRAVQGAGQLQRTEADAATETDHEQLVTFRLGHEEYGFSIMDVKEIIRVPEITQAPNAPPGVEGITCLRNQVLPVLDLRTKFGFPTLAAEMSDLLAKMKAFDEQHRLQLRELQQSIGQGSETCGDFSYEETDFARWRKTASTADTLLNGLLTPLEKALKAFGAAARTVSDQFEHGDRAGAQEEFRRLVQPASVVVETLFKKLFVGIGRRDDERCLVIGVGNGSLALRIDAVNEVMQVSKSSVEKTPEAAAGAGGSHDQIRGVAKLDDGKRLIMLLDAERLVSSRDLAAIKAAARNNANGAASPEGATSMNANRDDEDRQFVSFKVADEEFASDIMLVQEIIRLAKVTRVPHAPDFVEGVVNLRGNVLPVIDLRRRFGMEEKDYDDATRVVVVDIDRRKTGIIVDAVSEVLNLPKSAVEPAPAIVKAGVDEDFIEGVGKIEGGERMLLVLRIDKLLSESDLSSLRDLADGEPLGAGSAEEAAATA
jgi:chemotaxis signal transduction protein